ncbi:hypothetical protein [Nocardioides sp.]|uniref:hypothetical protein n=1 Tax=Nocardioides sp. TaxID=35761 RepID=UPI00351542D9
MGRRKSADGSGRPAPAPTPGIIDGKVLLIAALVCSPAIYRASQGLLSVDEVLQRYLFVALACAATAMLVRALWPLLAGPVAKPTPRDAAGAIQPGAAQQDDAPTGRLVADPPDPVG